MVEGAQAGRVRVPEAPASVAPFATLVANHPEFIRHSSVTDKLIVGMAAEITERSGSWGDRKETGFLVTKVLPRGGGS